MPETLPPSPSRRVQRGELVRGETPNDGDTEGFGRRTPSRDAAERYRGEIRGAVEAVLRKEFPPRDAIVWPGGLDRAMLLELPLRKRTRNILEMSDLMTGDGPVTGRDLLYAPSVNRRMATEIVRAVDGFLGECIETVEGGPFAADRGDRTADTD